MSETQDARSGPPGLRIVAGLAVLFVFGAASLVLWRTDMLDRLLDGEALEQAVMQLGPLGPLLIIGLMTVAIVMSPLPSAPMRWPPEPPTGTTGARSMWPSAQRPVP